MVKFTQLQRKLREVLFRRNKVLQSCTSLQGEYHVFHSVGWISRTEGGARDGEADFLICPAIADF